MECYTSQIIFDNLKPYNKYRLTAFFDATDPKTIFTEILSKGI